MLILSGFDLYLEPETHGLPTPVVIKKAARGPVQHSCKILLAPFTGKKESCDYFVEIADDENFENFRLF